MSDKATGFENLAVHVTLPFSHISHKASKKRFLNLFIYLGFYVTFNTVQVISQPIVLWAEETSRYSWSRFCTVNCRPSVSNYQVFNIRSRV